MVAEDGSNGAWCGDTARPLFYFYRFSVSQIHWTKGWKAVWRFVVFITEFAFQIANDKMLIVCV